MHRLQEVTPLNQVDVHTGSEVHPSLITRHRASAIILITF